MRASRLPLSGSPSPLGEGAGGWGQPLTGFTLVSCDEQRIKFARRDAEMDAHPEITLTWQQIRSSIEGKT